MTKWRPGANCGGGYGQVGIVDGDDALVLGDMWGACRSWDGGKTWRAVNEGAPSVPTGRAAAWSLHPDSKGTAYLGVGPSHGASPGSGYFGVMSPVGKIRVLEGSPHGFGLNINDANAHQPRPGGVIVCDYEPATDAEYVYGAGPTAITRYVNSGSGPSASSRIWTQGQCWKAGVLLDADRLMLATFTKDANGATQTPKVVVLSGIRGTALARMTTVKSGLAVNALRWIGGKLYAACSTGLYRIDDPLGPQSWVRLGTTFFDKLVTDVCGEGDVLYVGQASETQDVPKGHAVAKSTDGGRSWKWTAGVVHPNLYGTTSKWWLSDLSNGQISGGAHDTSQMAYANGRVYNFGRKGCWISDDAGVSWWPAVRGMGGSSESHIALGSFGVNAADQDWGAAESSDRFATCKRASERAYPPAALQRMAGGHTYRVVEGSPCDITRDGTSIADDVFRGWATRGNLSDLAVDGSGTIYVVASGGALLVGDPA